IDLGTVAALIDDVTGRRTAFGQTYDVGGPDVLKYREMLDIVAHELGVKRPSLRVPFVSPRISRWWVSLITGAPKALVKPLIESLRHDMVCRDRRLQVAAQQLGLPFAEAVRGSIASNDHSKPQAYAPAPPAKVTGVRSVQRIDMPPDRDAEWAAHEYMHWLPSGAWPIHVVSDHHITRFSLFGRYLLELEFAEDRSGKDRQLFYITGGRLANVEGKVRGRLEFRVAPNGKQLLTAIHDFAPSLPWAIYRYTQALVHRFVMWRFGQHLKKLRPVQKSESSSPASRPSASLRS
ncbi:MAG TPA: hypothetical protein VGC41_26675, partial [Kofleriaceae bacterium]